MTLPRETEATRQAIIARYLADWNDDTYEALEAAQNGLVIEIEPHVAVWATARDITPSGASGAV